MESIVSAATTTWNLTDQLSVLQQWKIKTQENYGDHSHRDKCFGKKSSIVKISAGVNTFFIEFTKTSGVHVKFDKNLCFENENRKKWFLVFFSQTLSKITLFDTCNKFLNKKAKGELHHCVFQKAVSQQCINLIVIVHIKNCIQGKWNL